MSNGYRVWNGRKVLQMDDGDGCTTRGIYLMPRNWTLQDGHAGRVCYMYFIIIKKKSVRITVDLQNSYGMDQSPTRERLGEKRSSTLKRIEKWILGQDEADSCFREKIACLRTDGYDPGEERKRL